MRAQIMIEFAVTFVIIFTLIVILILSSESKINYLSSENEKEYNLIKCIHASDYIVDQLSTNFYEINTSAVKNFASENNYSIILANQYGTVIYGNYTYGNKVIVRRYVIYNNTLTTMDLVCGQ